MKANDPYLLLLHGSFTGDLSGEERQTLDQWLAADPGHAELARQFALIWEQSGTYQPAVALDMDSDFEVLLERIRRQEPVLAPSIPIHGWRRRWLSIAAVAVLLISAVLFYRQYTIPAVTWQTVAAAATSIRQVDLADGSRVWLRPNSSLSFPGNFSSVERRVRLSGEAFFEVAPRAAQSFLVETDNGGRVEVLGTSFGILSENVVLVKTGKVRYAPDASGDGVVLTAGQRAQYFPASRKLTVGLAPSFNELAWQTGGLEFVQTPLRQVLADMEAYYRVRIALENSGLQECLHTAPLTNQPVEQVLNGLALTYQLKVAQPQPGNFVLTGGNCQ